MNRSASRRSAMTLIELLVVMSIIVVMATLAAMVLPALRQKDNSVKAATAVSASLSIVKQQALRDQAPRGIRLIPSAEDPTLVREIQYIELPDAIIPTPNVFTTNIAGVPTTVSQGVTVTIVPITPRASPSYYRVILANARFNNNWYSFGVQVGDNFSLTHQGRSYVATVTSIVNGANANDTLIVLPLADYLPDPNVDDLPLGSHTDGFKVVRKPRPLVGEDNIRLPRKMVIDLPRCTPGRPWNAMADPLDIVFLPSGEITGAADGKIVLWVRSEDDTAVGDFGKMTLVVIYTRTGQIIMHPVAAVGDPYAFTKDGLGSGL